MNTRLHIFPGNLNKHTTWEDVQKFSGEKKQVQECGVVMQGVKEIFKVFRKPKHFKRVN